MGGDVVIESDLLDADARDGVLGPFQARIGGEGGAQIFELGWGQGMGGLDVDGHVSHSHACGGTAGGRCGMNGPRSACRPSAGSTVRPGRDMVAGYGLPPVAASWPVMGYRRWQHRGQLWATAGGSIVVSYGLAPVAASLPVMDYRRWPHRTVRTGRVARLSCRCRGLVTSAAAVRQWRPGGSAPSHRPVAPTPPTSPCARWTVRSASR